MTWLRTYGTSLLYALLLSFVLWSYVSFTKNPDRSTSFDAIPVQVQNLPSGLVIVDQYGLPRSDQTILNEVSIMVKTDQDTLSKLSQKYLKPLVDLKGLSAGDHQIPVEVDLTRTDLRLSHFSLLTTDPEFVPVRLEEWITATVPLSIEVRGNLPTSFERGQPEARYNNVPIDKIQIEGPQNRVEQVVGVQVVANIEQLSTNYVSQREVEAINTNKEVVQGITLKPSQVSVRVPIRSVVGIKRVPVLATIVGSPAPGYVVTDIKTEPQLINITGSSRILDEIAQVETIPINIDTMTGVFTKQVGLLFPPGVSRQLSSSSLVEVSIEIKPLLRPFQVIFPFVVNITGNTDLIVHVVPDILDVNLVGDSTALGEINPSRLKATVNVQGLQPGTHTLKPHIELPDGVNFTGTIPDVQVTLSLPPTPTSIPTPIYTSTNIFLPTNFTTGTIKSETFPPSPSPIFINPLATTSMPNNSDQPTRESPEPEQTSEILREPLSPNPTASTISRDDRHLPELSFSPEPNEPSSEVAKPTDPSKREEDAQSPSPEQGESTDKQQTPPLGKTFEMILTPESPITQFPTDTNQTSPFIRNSKLLTSSQRLDMIISASPNLQSIPIR